MNARLGLDWTGDQLRAVRPRAADSLVSFDLLEKLGEDVVHTEGEDNSITLAFPDSESLMTIVKLPDMIDWKARTLFELSQSLLEPIDTFRVVLEPSPLSNQILATLVRKDRLNHLAERLGFNGGREQLSILPRGMALANGFRTFCTRPTGDLLCLLDLDGSHATICLTFRNQPLLCGSIPFTDVTADSAAPARFAIDLRTWINLHLASLAQYGLSTPLGAVAVAGESVSDQVLAQLTKQFLCPVAAAAWEPERAPLDADGRPLGTAYLVALGTLAK